MELSDLFSKELSELFSVTSENCLQYVSISSQWHLVGGDWNMFVVFPLGISFSLTNDHIFQRSRVQTTNQWNGAYESVALAPAMVRGDFSIGSLRKYGDVGFPGIG